MGSSPTTGRWLRALPIERKLTLTTLATCAGALLLACAGLAAFGWQHVRESMARDMTVLVNVLTQNTQAAVIFNDGGSAQATLGALRAEPHIVISCLYAGTAPFAQYVRAGEAATCPAQAPGDGHRFESDSLRVTRPVELDGKRIGAISLRADLEGIDEQLRGFAGIAAIVLLASMLVAFALSTRLQRLVSRPILELTRTARNIAERQDFSVRAVKEADNELGVLTDAFNHMLVGIEERERALGERNDALRREIGEREHAERQVQSELSRQALLNHLTRAIGERQDLSSIFLVVLGRLEKNLAIEFSSVYLYDAATEEFVIDVVGPRAHASGAAAGLEERISAGDGTFARCVEGELVHAPDIAGATAPLLRHLAAAGLRSVVLAPLRVESRVLGALVVARTRPDGIGVPECEFLRQLSEHVALAAYHVQLYEALQKAYDDLRQSQQTVMQQERLRALGEMASGIAHDINNAISPVALYTESLLEREPNLSERARSYLSTIQGAVEDVAQTVARMREFYRTREQQLTLAPVELNRVVDQIAQLTRARWYDMAQQRGVSIEMRMDLAAGLPDVMAAESEIREALTNLVFNAVDAMASGGTLTLRTRFTGAVKTDGANGAPPQIALEVSDTGVGMDEETRQRCLEPFYTTKGERGTGLGLAMVYGTVKRHSAAIEIESAPGRGTTVRLLFSALTTGPSEGMDAPSAVIKPPRLRLLIVDDDPLLIRSLRDTLEADGHEVVAAEGGQRGIDAFRAALEREEPFSAVVTDLGMPYVDGRQVAVAINAIAPHTPVLLLTGWGQRLLAEGDVPPHVSCVLAKPPKLQELRSAFLRYCCPNVSEESASHD